VKKSKSVDTKQATLFIGLLLIGFLLGVVYTKNHLQQKDQTQPQIVYKEKKYPYEFKLKNYKDFIYKLKWEAYYIPESENTVDNPLSKENYDTKIQLVRAPITAPNQIEVVKNLDLNLKTGIFELTDQSLAPNEAEFGQHAGWTDGSFKWKLNLDTGEYTQITR
jgi:hypothetical protein